MESGLLDMRLIERIRGGGLGGIRTSAPGGIQGPFPRKALIKGTIDAIIHQDMTRIADPALNCLIGVKGSPVSAGIPIEIITRENLMHR